MKELTIGEAKMVGGGFLPVIIVEIIAVAAAADILYNAGKAFGEGYNENDKV